MRDAVARLALLEDRLRQGGGPDKIGRQHAAGKMTARERICGLLDVDSPFLELGLLVAHDRYEGQAPAAGVVTGVGRVDGRHVVVLANDATVKAGAWWPETVQKILRAQEVAIRNRLPIVYLVDSAGANLPLQDGIFPGRYGAGRIFYYSAQMRRRLRLPQFAAVMGPCVAGGAYLPALADLIVMVDDTSFMGIAGSNLVKAATSQVVDAETLGGTRLHTGVSGVAHMRAADDCACLNLLRQRIADLPVTLAPTRRRGQGPARSSDALLDLVPPDHRLPYDVEVAIDCLFDAGPRTEFQPNIAPELLCAYVRLEGRAVGVLANRRGVLASHGESRIGGILYSETARKAAYFVDACDRAGIPLIYLQDVVGFMVGPEAEASGIIRAGAEMIESMACATVPRIVLTVSHANGAGYYAMSGQGFDPHFTFAWPTARIGVMEGEAAVMAVHGPALELLRRSGSPIPSELEAAVASTLADYERWLDAQHAAARGHVDALVSPLDTRATMAFALDVACASGAGVAPVSEIP